MNFGGFLLPVTAMSLTAALGGLIILANTTREDMFHKSHVIFLQAVCTLLGEKLNDVERKQEVILKRRLRRGKLSAAI
jgi:shikimate kinase